jgi:hypothetical protein
MFVPRHHQTAGQNRNIKVANKSFKKHAGQRGSSNIRERQWQIGSGDEMNGRCNRHGTVRSVCRISIRKPENKKPLEGPRYRCNNNIKMDFRETGCVGVDWIQLAQNRDRWRALVNTVLNFPVPHNTRNILCSWAYICSSKALHNELNGWVEATIQSQCPFYCLLWHDLKSNQLSRIIWNNVRKESVTCLFHSAFYFLPLLSFSYFFFFSGFRMCLRKKFMAAAWSTFFSRRYMDTGT